MKTKFYLDKREKAKVLTPDSGAEREYPIKIAINHRGSSAYISTGISVPISKWQSKPGTGRVVNTYMADRLNITLSEKKLAVDKAIEKLRTDGKLHGASASVIKTFVERELELDSFGTDSGEMPVIACFDRKIKTLAKARTIEAYSSTKAKLQGYGDFPDKATFHYITQTWLAGFEIYLSRTMPSANARAIHLRNLKAIFNMAINEKLTTADYPFKSFKIKYEPTEDLSMTPEELTELHNAPCNPAAEKYRDLFFLSFFLCGMNLKDILALTPKNIKGGRVETRRIKTGQPLTIKLEKEALDLIYKYKDNTGERLLSIGKGINYNNFLHRLNDQLKNIGRIYNPHTKKWDGESLFPDLSFYWARYSFATIAAELDIPERTIGAAMGHSTKKTVTSIYTRVDMRRKIDAANRKVIDFCFKNLENL